MINYKIPFGIFFGRGESVLNGKVRKPYNSHDVIVNGTKILSNK